MKNILDGQDDVSWKLVGVATAVAALISCISAKRKKKAIVIDIYPENIVVDDDVSKIEE